MRILGIDYGRRKIGVALATSRLAEPYGVVRFGTFDEAIEKIGAITLKEEIEEVVVGIPEGEMANEVRLFSKKLSKKLDRKTILSDEVLSTKTAQKLAIEAGIKRGRRKRLEDAFAAAVMLQLFIDKKESDNV
jgi:putative Holliday junction resolvase